MLEDGVESRSFEKRLFCPFMLYLQHHMGGGEGEGRGGGEEGRRGGKGGEGRGGEGQLVHRCIAKS